MPSLLERLRDALAPRYEIEGEVASGGMATVFRAVDQSLGRVVAVKVLRPDMATATGEARFLREARTMASFSHPNVVSIHDADERDGPGPTCASRSGAEKGHWVPVPAWKTVAEIISRPNSSGMHIPRVSPAFAQPCPGP